MLTLEGIGWQLDEGEEILRDVSLEIPDGKMTVVTGPNGGGKTSLAKIIAGLAVPTRGKLYLDGEDITEWDITERARHGISYAFQQPVRFKGLSVRDLLEISAEQKLTRGQVCEYLGEVGLCAEEYVDRAGIDLWSFSNLVQVFQRLKQRSGEALLVISHQERILEIADRIVVIADGKVRTAGEREAILPGLLAGEKADRCPQRERSCSE